MHIRVNLWPPNLEKKSHEKILQASPGGEVRGKIGLATKTHEKVLQALPGGELSGKIGLATDFTDEHELLASANAGKMGRTGG